MKIVIDIPEEVYKCVMDGTYCGTLYEELKNGVPAEPERKPGKWIEHQDRRKQIYAECSNCGFKNYAGILNYCPECGADMRGEQALKYADNDTAFGGLQSAT